MDKKSPRPNSIVHAVHVPGLLAAMPSSSDDRASVMSSSCIVDLTTVIGRIVTGWGVATTGIPLVHNPRTERVRVRGR
jgi:hypothetical protein